MAACRATPLPRLEAEGCNARASAVIPEWVVVRGRVGGRWHQEQARCCPRGGPVQLFPRRGAALFGRESDTNNAITVLKWGVKPYVLRFVPSRVQIKPFSVNCVLVWGVGLHRKGCPIHSRVGGRTHVGTRVQQEPYVAANLVQNISTTVLN